MEFCKELSFLKIVSKTTCNWTIMQTKEPTMNKEVWRRTIEDFAVV